MLIVFRIKKKANLFHSAVDQLKQAADAAAQGANTSPQTPLGALHNAAESAMSTLVSEAEALKIIDLGTGDAQIVTKYLAVVEAYGKLSAKPAFTAALEAKNVTEVKDVTTKFEALQNSIVNVLRLRVRELSEKSEVLKNEAGKIDVPELAEKAGLLATAASQGSDQGLKEKATKLVEAINSGTGVETKAGDVIEKFEDVRTKYQALTSHGNYATHKDKPAVKAVDDAYNNLREVYDKILNVTKATQLQGQVGEKDATSVTDQKILQKANDLYTNANTLASAPGLTAQDTELKKQLRELATNLANAVGDSGAGLQKALNDLKNAKENEIVEKAQDVITKYNAVKDAYDAVKAKEEEYTKALKGTTDETHKYTDVTSAFQALQFCPPWKLYKYIKLP
uniref:Tpr-related protein family member, putative n=1 Tax=Theileria annulata TaxID=5874 RepID=A0A3B0MUI5_THEAN